MSRAPRPQRIGIREVALAAGVSATTVSHALNDKGRLPEGTRRRVKEVAERLGYRPSPAAQRLVDGRTGLLGITITAPSTVSARAMADVGYFVQVLSAASSTALANGYSLVLTAGPTGPAATTPALDGAIIVDPVTHDPTLSAMRAAGTPTVTAGRVPEGQTAPWVDNDHRAGTGRLLAHLERQGAQTVALISPPLVTTYARDIKDAYSAWCYERGSKPQIVIARRDLGEAAGYAAAMRILDAGPVPDAILGSLDRLALGALLAAQTRGVDVPDDLLIAAYSDSQLNLHTNPSITALQLHPDQIGRRAVEVLIDLVEGRESGARHVEIPVRLIARGSTLRSGR